MKYRYVILTLLLVVHLLSSSKLVAQVQDPFSLTVQDKSLKEIFTLLEREANIQFIYNDAKVALYRHLSIDVRKKLLAPILDQLLSGTDLTYFIRDSKVIISPKGQLEQQAITNGDDLLFYISGIITDKRGEPVAGANVFLSRTQKFTISDDNGKFKLGPVAAGKYELISKMLGFSADKQNLIIESKPEELSIILKEEAIDLRPVVVKADKKDPFRDDYLKIFKQFFVGESVNAAECELVNPEVLNFKYYKFRNRLEANSSDDFLIVNNYSLGYKIRYLLMNFRLDLSTNLLIYNGLIYYEELDGSAEQKLVWDKNRRLTFLGSTRHFFRSVFRNDTEKEGFVVYQLPKRHRRLDKLALLNIKPVKIDSIFSVSTKEVKELSLKKGSLTTGNVLRVTSTGANTRPLYIVYTGKKEPIEFLESGRHIISPAGSLPGTTQVSSIQPLSTQIIIDKNGEFPAQSLLFKGYWSWQGISDMLPIDYVDASEISQTP